MQKTTHMADLCRVVRENFEAAVDKGGILTTCNKAISLTVDQHARDVKLERYNPWIDICRVINSRGESEAYINSQYNSRFWQRMLSIGFMLPESGRMIWPLLDALKWLAGTDEAAKVELNIEVIRAALPEMVDNSCAPVLTLPKEFTLVDKDRAEDSTFFRALYHEDAIALKKEFRASVVPGPVIAAIMELFQRLVSAGITSADIRGLADRIKNTPEIDTQLYFKLYDFALSFDRFTGALINVLGQTKSANYWRYMFIYSHLPEARTLTTMQMSMIDRIALALSEKVSHDEIVARLLLKDGPGGFHELKEKKTLKEWTTEREAQSFLSMWSMPNLCKRAMVSMSEVPARWIRDSRDRPVGVGYDMEARRITGEQFTELLSNARTIELRLSATSSFPFGFLTKPVDQDESINNILAAKYQNYMGKKGWLPILAREGVYINELAAAASRYRRIKHADEIDSYWIDIQRVVTAKGVVFGNSLFRFFDSQVARHLVNLNSRNIGTGIFAAHLTIATKPFHAGIVRLSQSERLVGDPADMPAGYIQPDNIFTVIIQGKDDSVQKYQVTVF